jgi:hypothetical protein
MKDKVRDWLLVVLLGLVCFLLGQDVFQPAPAEAQAPKKYAVLGFSAEDDTGIISEGNIPLSGGKGVIYEALPKVLNDAAKQGWRPHTIIRIGKSEDRVEQMQVLDSGKVIPGKIIPGMSVYEVVFEK